MRNRIVEESILFISVLKWIVLSSGIGLIVGITTAFFLKILKASIALATPYPDYFWFLPLGLFLSALIVKYIAKDASGYGTERVIGSVHQQSGKIRATVMPVKLVATVLTATVGGSVGQIGPCAQIGGGLASLLAEFFKFDDTDRKKLVICGISAGFASVLGAPVAGAIFGVEVLFVGTILYEVLLPSFIAGIIGYHTASFFGITYFHYTTHIIPAFSEAFFLKIVVAGIFFGLCAIIVIEAVRIMDALFERFTIWSPLKGIIGGIILIILTFLFSTRYLGLGLDTIREVLQGAKIASYAFLMKTVFTAITFASGGSGGIIAPIFFIGATAGSFLGDLLNLDRSTFAAIGLVSVLAGAANTPIAMSILAIELFGGEIGAYAAVACVISFLITGHRSIFPTQIMAMQKSSSVEVELGKEMSQVKARFHRRRKSIVDKGLRALGKRMEESKKK
jgi:H+/Cl- antiporter ClcA